VAEAWGIVVYVEVRSRSTRWHLARWHLARWHLARWHLARLLCKPITNTSDEGLYNRADGLDVTKWPTMEEER